LKKVEMLAKQKLPQKTLAFVDDGINDAPVLAITFKTTWQGVPPFVCTDHYIHGWFPVIDFFGGLVYMDIRIENRNTFYVSGYSVETSEASLEKDCVMLREKHEDKLRSISDHLYFVSWMAKEGVMAYLFGVETTSKTPATNGAICMEIPATGFAAATVLDGAPVLATWYDFFETF